MADLDPISRDTIFISKATPLDNEFALWLAPRLEAEGYKVFADILSLEPGDRWRKTVTSTLQDRAVKMLLCCKDDTLAADGVIEEIEIASDLTKSLKDTKFIIPLRLKQFKKVFGIGGLQYIDFERGWAEGLDNLLDALKRQKVPRNEKNIVINPNWEMFRRRGAVPLLREPERLTSNWLRIAHVPDVLRYFEPAGASERGALEATAAKSPYPVEVRPNGILTFATQSELEETFVSVCKFRLAHEFKLMDFVENGCAQLELKKQDASNIAVSMFRQAWIRFCQNRGLLKYEYSNAIGFHVSADLAKIGERIPWGRQGEKRSSMLRNVAKGCVWQYGVTGLPNFWPFPHFKLKSRVLFAPLIGTEAGDPFDGKEKKKQHKLRRTVCKGWRNKQWHGRLLAFLELISGDSSFVQLPLSPSFNITLDTSPLLFTSPVSTMLPDELTDEQEETDLSTLGRPEPEDEE